MTQELTRLGEEQRPKPRNSWSKPSNHPESWKTMWNHGESSRFIDADRGSMTKHKVQVWFVGLSSLVWMLFGTREDPGQDRVVERTSRARFMLHHR